MSTLNNFLYRLAGAVSQYVTECPLSEQQRYRNIAYGMMIVWTVTYLSAHHAAVLGGVNDPIAWLPASIWALFMVACDRMVVMALTRRSDRPISRVPIIVRLALVLINATILSYFAILGCNENGLARIRFVQQQHAIAEDQQFFVSHYHLQEHQNELASSTTAMGAVKAKLAVVPPNIANLRAKVGACRNEVEVLQRANTLKRSNLSSELAGLTSRIYALRRGTLIGSRQTEPVSGLEVEAERVRRRLAALDGEEASRRRVCEELAAREAIESRNHYGPLNEEKSRIQKELDDAKEATLIARRKVDASVVESEQVSKAAFGFNLSGEGNALMQLLNDNWLARIIASVVWAISVCLETLPILLKLRACGGPYDERVAREDRSSESLQRHTLDLVTIQLNAETEKIRELTPKEMEIAKPLLLFALTEEEIAKARVVREKAAKADLSRLQEIDDSFHAAVARSRQLLRESWLRPTPTTDAPSGISAS